MKWSGCFVIIVIFTVILYQPGSGDVLPVKTTKVVDEKLGKTDGKNSEDTKDSAAEKDSDSDEGLPFPVIPSEFWEFAINLLSDHTGHFFAAIIPKPIFKWANGSSIKTGPFIGGLVATPGGRGGKSKEGEKKNAVEVLLIVHDHIYFNLDLDPIIIAVDKKAGKPPPCVLATLDPEKVIKKFATDFGNPALYPLIKKEHAKDPEKFINKYLQLFYPASISFNFNSKIDPGRLGDKTLRNRKPINLSAPDLKSFVPEEVGFSSKETIEMMDEDKNTVIQIPKFTLLTSHVCCKDAHSSGLVVAAIKGLFGVTAKTKRGELKLPKDNDGHNMHATESKGVVDDTTDKLPVNLPVGGSKSSKGDNSTDESGTKHPRKTKKKGSSSDKSESPENDGDDSRSKGVADDTTGKLPVALPVGETKSSKGESSTDDSERKHSKKTKKNVSSSDKSESPENDSDGSQSKGAVGDTTGKLPVALPVGGTKSSKGESSTDDSERKHSKKTKKKVSSSDNSESPENDGDGSE